MRTIGIRAAPRVVTFAIYDATSDSVLNIEQLKIPAAFETPAALKYIRSNLLDILREYRIQRAGIRITEPNAQSINIERIQIEGVIQEAFASSGLDSYFVGQISSISKKLGIERIRFKPMIAGEDDPGIEKWGDMSKEQREAVLCAKGAKYA
jgi:hypothetical protein